MILEGVVDNPRTRQAGLAGVHTVNQYSSMTKAQLIEEIERLRESERRLRDLFENAPFGYQSLDEAGNFIACNETWCRTLGYEREEVLGRNFSEFIHPEYLEVFEEKFPTFKAAGYILGVEFGMVKKDGSEMLVSFDGKIGRDSDGSVIQTHCVLQDITERKESEARLVDSEERYRAYVEHAPNAVFVVNPQGRYIHANQGASRLTGYSIPELLGLAIPDITAPEGLEEALGVFGTLKETGRISSEFPLLRKDGHRVIASLDAVQLPGGDYMAFCSDISKRREAEEALQESNNRYRAFFEHGPDGIVILDPETGRIVEFNDGACHQLGYTREEFGRLSVVDIEAVETADDTSAHIQNIVLQGHDDFETRHRTKQGNIRDVRVMARVIRVGGGSAYHCVWRDITDRKRNEEKLRESEERLRSVLDTSPFPVAVVDSNGEDVVFWSRSAHDLFGHTAPTASEWYQKAYPDPDYRREVIAQWEPALDMARESGRTVNTGEYRVWCSDGSERICELYATVLPQNLIVTFDDVTERKWLEDALRDSRDRLRGLAGELERVREEERTNLARELHDEVGQALTALKMDLETMENELHPGQEHFSGRLGSLIEIALDSVQRVNRMSAELRSPILDVLGLQDAVESEVWEYRQRRGLDVGLEMDLPPLARSRERDLAVYRILQESLSNVRRHAQVSRATVRLKVAGARLVMEVADDGIGITGEQLRDHQSFGLIGMRERAGRFGGRVEIRRRMEGGTLVRAEIPIASPEGMVE